MEINENEITLENLNDYLNNKETNTERKATILNEIAIFTLVIDNLSKDLKYELEIKKYLDDCDVSYLDLYIKLKGLDNRTDLKLLSSYIENATTNYSICDDYCNKLIVVIKDMYDILRNKISKYDNISDEYDKIAIYEKGNKDDNIDYLTTLSCSNLDNEALSSYGDNLNIDETLFKKLLNDFYLDYAELEEEILVKNFTDYIEEINTIEEYGELWKYVSRLDILKVGSIVYNL